MNFTFNICTDSLPFCHLDNDEFSVAIYELANGTRNVLTVIDCLALNLIRLFQEIEI